MRAVLLVPIGLMSGVAVAYGGPCPASIPDDVQTSAHLERTLRDVSFYEGDLKDQVEVAPEPNKLKKHWRFTHKAGQKITFVCRYHGTEKTVVDVLPPSIKSCTLANQMTSHGEIPGLLALECT